MFFLTAFQKEYRFLSTIYTFFFILNLILNCSNKQKMATNFDTNIISVWYLNHFERIFWMNLFLIRLKISIK